MSERNDEDTTERLKRLIEASGLSRAQFARWVLGRDERTLRRWLSGQVAIPEQAEQWIFALQSVKGERRITVVIEPPRD